MYISGSFVTDKILSQTNIQAQIDFYQRYITWDAKKDEYIGLQLVYMSNLRELHLASMAANFPKRYDTWREWRDKETKASMTCVMDGL